MHRQMRVYRAYVCTYIHVQFGLILSILHTHTIRIARASPSFHIKYMQLRTQPESATVNPLFSLTLCTPRLHIVCTYKWATMYFSINFQRYIIFVHNIFSKPIKWLLRG
ncbi:unnamed protein product [Ixodes persulcatus]